MAEIDLAAAHRHFSAECFNRAWDLIDRPGRTLREDEEMLALSLTSHWHWTQRDDYQPRHASTGYWQTSRIYALMGQADNARRYAELSRDEAQHEGVPPFYLAYSYEALARAAVVAGQRDEAERHLGEARELAEAVSDAQSREMLLKDLADIQRPATT